MFSKAVSRSKLTRTVATLPSCLVAMEACGGAYHWARTFQGFGHDVKLIAPQFVKPYVKSNKNDRANAAAICEAATAGDSGGRGGMACAISCATTSQACTRN